MPSVRESQEEHNTQNSKLSFIAPSSEELQALKEKDSKCLTIVNGFWPESICRQKRMPYIAQEERNGGNFSFVYSTFRCGECGKKTQWTITAFSFGIQELIAKEL